ncbi:hypothetical protein L1D55_25200 [Vibrio sp. Isolate22]|uniref:hypothetical protein n=1 Tax=Vibrio sp. Isolate22 TaxID=2908532 RepID=UPI001EFE0CF7|nr:hypothetical protein [Vibrio sp. Isolate22]MCG9694961.1 hypothetical protein [Vibrio sp. Isolate22]
MNQKTRLRNLGGGLNIISDCSRQDIDVGFWQECCAELKIYAVLRTKGGSGERHTVRVLQQQLIQRGERPLIVRVFRVRDNEYGTDFDSLAELENSEELTGSFMWDWSECHCNHQLAQALFKSSFTSVILTQGGSSGVDYKDVMNAAELARHTYLTVNIDCDSSVESHTNIVEELKNSMLNVECVSSVLWKGNRWDEPNHELMNLSNVSVEHPLSAQYKALNLFSDFLQIR